MKKRYSILAKFLDGHYFYLNFNDPKILEYLEQIPLENGLLVLAKWPIYEHMEIEFFMELINGNIEYYRLMDRYLNTIKTVTLQ